MECSANGGSLQLEKNKKYKILGKTRYLGKDKILPSNWCITICTVFMILIPSSIYFVM